MNFLICSLFLFSSIVFAQSTWVKGDFPKGQTRNFAIVSKTIKHRDGSITYLNPRFKTPYGVLPVYGVGSSAKLCNMLGHMGAFTKNTKIKVSDGKKMLKLYGSFQPKGFVRVNPLTDYKASYQVDESQGSYPARDHFHYLTQVTCSSLKNFF